jgi:hypothetical protein
MKFNFKKIASVIASTVMLSSTVALAAAANYPAPFVSSGVADVAVVYGANAAQTDLVAATDITTNLNSKLVVAGAATTMTGGDSFKLEKTTNKFNLDEDLNDIYSTLDDEELSTVLASGVYWSDANEDFDYEQKIDLGDAALGFWQDNDFNDQVPYIGFKLASGNHILNYTLDFTDAVDCGDFGLVADTTTPDDCETTDLSMLGRTYYIVKTESTANGVKLTLLDSANSATVTDGETSALTVGGASYDVGIVFVDSDEVILDVNGAQTNKLKEGDVFKVTGTEDLYIGVKSVLYNEKESGVSKVEISLGSGKIVLENKQEVEFNGEDVSDITDPEAIVKAYITNTTTELNKIVLEWNMNDDAWIAPGTDLILPGFETIKLSMGGFIEPSTEVTSLETDSDDSITLSTTVSDGDVDFNILYSNATEFIGLGKDSDSLLATNHSNVLTLNSDNVEWFVASTIEGDEAESFVLKVTNIDDGTDGTKNTTTIESQASGSSQKLELDIGESDDLGDIPITFTLNAANEITGVVRLTITGGDHPMFDTIYTVDGLKIQLPVDTANAGDGAINITAAAPATFTMNFTEETEDGDINQGSSFTVGLGLTDGETDIKSVPIATEETEDGSDIYEGYVESALATKTIFDTSGDKNTLDVEYHGEESYADVFVSESAAAVTAEGGVTILPVTDAETTSAKNLIVVGGSCINTVAAGLLGGALCGADFEAATGVGAGSFLIETFSRTGGGVATLVAGYNAGDTTNAATYFTTQTVDTTADKKYIGTSATAATLVVATE